VRTPPHLHFTNAIYWCKEGGELLLHSPVTVVEAGTTIYIYIQPAPMHGLPVPLQLQLADILRGQGVCSLHDGHKVLKPDQQGAARDG
jgi:hypothetical protein